MSMNPSPYAGTPAPTPQPGWWSRNWKWFVPTGCLTLLALIAAFVAGIVLIVFGALKSTDVYKESVARAKNNPAVIEALGSPIMEGMFLSGNTNVNGASGNSDISVPISGPKGKGTLYVVATKSAGKWSYAKMVVEVADGGKRINLLGDDADADE